MDDEINRVGRHRHSSEIENQRHFSSFVSSFGPAHPGLLILGRGPSSAFCHHFRWRLCSFSLHKQVVEAGKSNQALEAALLSCCVHAGGLFAGQTRDKKVLVYTWQ